ncbi:uncharacterized protein LOC127079967 [Lathyrus oleraceus]|uniref:uncharacterized protein LOC127079967 n=1 Tax=Pisum sativum TaxID=3888 RepID=UPI0021D3959D|nr:uncharacterized protein LOC127079967 [Pisum sativum]
MTGSKSSNIIFGGKIVVFDGDFRKILPVIPREIRSDFIHATINSSYIWDHCKALRLTKNKRLQRSSIFELEQFSNWILQVGNGKLDEPNNGYANISIPSKLLITEFEDSIQSIIQFAYPNFEQNYQNEHFLQCRVILAGTIEIVDVINQYILGLIQGEEREYLSSDTVDIYDVNGNEAFDVLTIKFINILTTSGLPNHQITLKIGTPIMLLRNIDQSEGLCNGTQLILTRLEKHVIEANIIYGYSINGHFFYTVAIFV